MASSVAPTTDFMRLCCLLKNPALQKASRLFSPGMKRSIRSYSVRSSGVGINIPITKVTKVIGSQYHNS
jgi:hypothetical protein